MHEQSAATILQEARITTQTPPAQCRKDVRIKHKTMDQLGARYAKCSFDSFITKTSDQSKAVQSLKRMAESGTPENIVLFGPAGAGKDHLVSATMRRLMQSSWQPVCRWGSRGYSEYRAPIFWSDGVSLFRSVKSEFDQKPDESIVVTCIRASVLYLSDIVPLSGELSPFEAGVLFSILDSRYRDMRPTWVTANVSTRDELNRVIGTKNADRILDGAITHFCNWPSYRRTAKEQRVA